jgi:two-component system, NarL family, nitrate/nitrite response regulator NarL
MPLELLILSDIRFIREGLAEVLGHDGAFLISGVATDVENACALARAASPRVMLVDTALPCGIAAVASLRKCAPDAKIVAFALTETETEVIAWAQAGIDGYIPRNAPLTALVGLLRRIVHGEQDCPTQIACGMLRWIGRHPDGASLLQPQAEHAGLTAREREIGSLMSAGLSNKDIARRLGISLATTKSHVHNILGKLGVSSRSQAIRHIPEHRLPATPLAILPARSRDLD